MLESGHLRILMLPTGIVGTSCVEFPKRWNGHLPDRIIRIAGIDKGEIVWSDTHGVPHDDSVKLLPLVGENGDEFLELIEGPEVPFQIHIGIVLSMLMERGMSGDGLWNSV